jgi:hypothetical protein
MANILRCSRSCQRLIVRCLLAAALVAAILCFGSTWPPAANAASSLNGNLLKRGPESPQERLVDDQAVKETDVVKETIPTQSQAGPAPSIRPSPKKQDAAISDQKWTKAVHDIEALLDDEYRLKALLTPITETGEPLLRDLTHRVRAFRDVFKSWEELHIDSDDGKSA